MEIEMRCLNRMNKAVRIRSDQIGSNRISTLGLGHGSLTLTFSEGVSQRHSKIDDTILPIGVSNGKSEI